MSDYAHRVELRAAAAPYMGGLPDLPELPDEQTRAYAASEHPHVPAGSSAGGQFAAKKKSNKSTPAKSGHSPHSHHVGHTGHGHANDSGDFSFNGKTGPGYGMPGGSKKVKNLQDQLVRLGLASKSDKALSDGRYGPKTAALVKKAQKALGLKADGIATPAFIAQLAKATHLPHAPRKSAHRSMSDALTYRLPDLPT